MALTIAKFRNSNGVLVPAPPTVVLRPKTEDPQQTLKVNRIVEKKVPYEVKVPVDKPYKVEVSEVPRDKQFQKLTISLRKVLKDLTRNLKE